MLNRTPFYDFHLSAGGRMVDFAGWEMPLLYKGIVEEHLHTRAKGSIFDVSHMGRLRFSGQKAGAFLNHVLTRNVAKQEPGVSRYSLVCNEAGGVLDDVIISRDWTDWLMVCNASNREKLLAHFEKVQSNPFFAVTIDDETEKTAMVAIQGPAVIERLAKILPVDIKAMKRYGFESAEVMFIKFTVFRSGYTGEDGVEVILPARAGAMAMKMLAGGLNKPDATLRPAGLGARDTLRIEAGMPLYGHELSENIDPISAGLQWAVDLNKEFIGAPALRAIAAEGPARRLVGLELASRRTARQGAPILDGDSAVGEVTSGTFSPTLQKSIAMAYVNSAVAVAGIPLLVDLKGTNEPARVVPLPFYKRAN